jgi:hypothetical protein
LSQERVPVRTLLQSVVFVEHFVSARATCTLGLTAVLHEFCNREIAAPRNYASPASVAKQPELCN